MTDGAPKRTNDTRRRPARRPPPIPERIFSAVVGLSFGAALGLALLSNPTTARALTFAAEVVQREADWPQPLLDAMTGQGE